MFNVQYLRVAARVVIDAGELHSITKPDMSFWRQHRHIATHRTGISQRISLEVGSIRRLRLRRGCRGEEKKGEERRVAERERRVEFSRVASRRASRQISGEARTGIVRGRARAFIPDVFLRRSARLCQ